MVRFSLSGCLVVKNFRGFEIKISWNLRYLGKVKTLSKKENIDLLKLNKISKFPEKQVCRQRQYSLVRKVHPACSNLVGRGNLTRIIAPLFLTRLRKRSV